MKFVSFHPRGSLAAAHYLKQSKQTSMTSFVEAPSTSYHHNGRPTHPLTALASHCVRLQLGESASRVVDALAAAPPSSLSFAGRYDEDGEEILEEIEGGWTFTQLLQQLRRVAVSTTAVVTSRTRTQRLREEAHLRAALVVLWQHSIVKVRIPPPLNNQKNVNNNLRNNQKSTSPHYVLDVSRAVYLGGPRAAKALAFLQKALDGTAAAVWEVLLCRGKARTIDLIQETLQREFGRGNNTVPNGDTDPASVTAHVPAHHANSPSPHPPERVASSMRQGIAATSCETVVNSLVQLVQGGFVQQVQPLAQAETGNKHNGGYGYHGVNDVEKSTDAAVKCRTSPPPRKKQKGKQQTAVTATTDEDPAIMAVLQQNEQYQVLLPPHAVWRVHWDMIHASLRATHLGRLVNEVHANRTGANVPAAAGSYVTAALRYQAAVQYGPAYAPDGDLDKEILTSGFLFKPSDIAKFLPKPVHQKLETQPGGVLSNLRKALLDLSEVTAQPRVLRRVGHDLFEVRQSTLLEYWKTRVVHQMISDRHGATAARIVSILLEKGWLEADTLAQYTMVPVKDTRAILHVLYGSGYVEIFPLYHTGGSAKHQTPGNAIYLWKVDEAHLHNVVREQIALATLNIRLRREHQVEQGRTFIERAQQESDENENETDKLNYQRFSLGLERLDVALQHLDETLMVLSEY